MVEGLLREPRVGPRELEDRLAEPQTDRRVDGDPRRRQEPDVRAAQHGPVAGPVDAPADMTGLSRMGPRTIVRIAVLDPELVDEERHAVDAGVEEERGRSKSGEQEGRDRESDPDPGQRGALESSGRLPAEELAAGGRDGDVAEDRRHA